ncbi:ABC transporter permease [Actinacidiphila sp. DG2A-62]|uniref:ABC transporter permease n=1 Tax=Actinacidiphila sp. DG2A-62 TaxID=3108821 RepID=UPI002DB685B5|nr:ABC transporter permease [Actinacidiphila sp. DG2A-62]MEC3994398.1 ABC transporter permease [Actinacidiphila sp. DG2A-62]
MAETALARAAGAEPAGTPGQERPPARTALGRAARGAAESLRAYRLIVAMWVRSTMAYRASFVMTALGNFAATGLDFVTIMMMFSHITVLGGFTLPEVAFLYGTTSTAFGLTDLALGSMDRLGRRVRDGTLDTLLLRPAPVLAQVAADRFALRRLGRVVQGLLVLGWAVARVDVAWTPLKVLLLPVSLVSGAAIFGAVFVAGAAFQFRAGDASEVQSSVTYGGNTMLQYPPTVFSKELVRGVVFVVPLAFVNWLPALYVLGRPDPLGLPRWVDFLSPPVALVCCALAGAAWRAGLRSYRSTGS